MLKAIVFDFDGVIVDSEPAHYRALLEVAEQAIGLTFGYEEYLRTYIGFDDRDAFRHMMLAAGKPVDERRVLELCRVKQQAFERIARDGVPMIPGARALIESAAAEMPIAIASGATSADIELIVGGLGLRNLFEVVVTANDVAASKPHPQTYSIAAEQLAMRHPGLDLRPSDCLAIEDTAAGLASATGAGLRTLGITTTSPAAALHRAARVTPNLAGVTLAQLRQWYA